MKSCVFPGSFDPFTQGHMDLIRRAAKMFDRVTVTVMINIRKKGALTPAKRVKLLKKACEGMENVRVDRWDGLLADYMREKGETCVIRGVRNAAEYASESAAAAINKLLNPEMETVMIPASDGLAHVSSSAVRELAIFGGDVRAFVPENVAEEIAAALANK